MPPIEQARQAWLSGGSMDLSKRRQRIWNALYAPVKAVMSRRFGYTFDRIDQKAPYLLIANHTTNVLDVFFTALATDRTPLVFVGSEHLMRSALGRFVRKNMGYISRPKGASALSTVREILTTLREGTRCACSRRATAPGTAGTYP